MRRGPHLGLMHCAGFSQYFEGPTGVLGPFPFGELAKFRFFIIASASNLSPDASKIKMMEMRMVVFVNAIVHH